MKNEPISRCQEKVEYPHLFLRYKSFAFSYFLILTFILTNILPTDALADISDYSTSTIKVLGTIDPEKINNDLIEELISWIVFGDHEVQLSDLSMALGISFGE